LAIIARLMTRLVQASSLILPAAVLLNFQLLWHFFFSPPQQVRLSFPVALASLLVLTAIAVAEMQRQAVPPRLATA
jgi:hypothetical protein